MKAIISVIGKDKKGIIAKVSTYLCENNINIEDISQTIMQGHFTMIMVVNIDDNNKIDQISDELNKIANEIDVEIRIQHETIFNAMHKI